MRDFLMIKKDAVDLDLLKVACEQTGCTLDPEHQDKDYYKVSADMDIRFFYLVEYICKIKAQSQFR